MKPRWLPTGKRSILEILRKIKGLCLEQSNKHLNISFFEKFDIKIIHLIIKRQWCKESIF